MDATWTPFFAATATICAVFAAAVWRQSQRSAAAATADANASADVAPSLLPFPAVAPAAPLSSDLEARRAALEQLLAAAPKPAGSWEDTAPLTVPPEEVMLR